MSALTQHGVTPGLATVLIGDDPGLARLRAQQAPSVRRHRHRLVPLRPAGRRVARDEVLELVAGLNADPKVDRYLIQHPVPAHLDYSELVTAMAPAKDADGLHPVNLGYLALGAPGHPRPGTPRAIVELLVRYKVPIEGRHVVIVGRGTTAGRPLAMLLSLKEPTRERDGHAVPHPHAVPARVHRARPTSSSRRRAGPG